MPLLYTLQAGIIRTYSPRFVRVAEENFVTAAGSGCVRVRGRHSGRPVR